MLRFVDDSHSTSAELAQEAIVTERVVDGIECGVSRTGEVLHHQHRREVLAEFLGKVWMSQDEVVDGDFFAFAPPLQELVRELLGRVSFSFRHARSPLRGVDPVGGVGGVDPVGGLSISRSRTMARR